MASKPKPALSTWLIDQRKARRETVEDIARVVDRSAATIRGWEAGRPPSSEDPSIVVLERHFGSLAPREETAVTDYSALVEAIDRQTAMLERVLTALGGSIPPDPLIAEAREEWAGAERRLAEEKAGASSLPRRPGRARRGADRQRQSREAGPA